MQLKNQHDEINKLKKMAKKSSSIGVKRLSIGARTKTETFLDFGCICGDMKYIGAVVSRQKVKDLNIEVIKDVVEGYVFECRKCGKYGNIIESRSELKGYVDFMNENHCPVCHGKRLSENTDPEHRLLPIKPIIKNSSIQDTDNTYKSTSIPKRDKSKYGTSREAYSGTPAVSKKKEEEKKNIEEVQKLIDESNYKDEFSQNKVPVQVDSRYGAFVIDRIKDWTAGEKRSATRFASEISKRNQNLVPMNIDRVEDADGMSQMSLAQCICKQCGELVPISYEDRNKKVCCPGCEKRISGHINYNGRYKRNYVGIVKNGLKAIEQKRDKLTGELDGTQVNVQCIACGRVIEDLNAYMFLNGLTYCGCDESGAKIKCSNCNSMVRVKKEYFINPTKRDREVVCPKCKIKLKTYEDLAVAEIRLDAKYTLKNKWDKAERIVDVIATTDSGLIRSKKVQYTGNSGKAYYRCYCIECDREFTLNDKEIANFSHEKYCSDSRYEAGDIRYPSLDNLDEIRL